MTNEKEADVADDEAADADELPSAYYDRLVDVLEELTKFTLLTRDRAAYLTNRYSDRKKLAERAE